jgi:hypothetical protein
VERNLLTLAEIVSIRMAMAGRNLQAPPRKTQMFGETRFYEPRPLK